MPNDFSRTDRIAEQIKRELAVLISNHVKDPRVGMVSILDVKVTKDLSQAKVYFDTLQVESHDECEKGLNRAAGFLRRELGRAIKLRLTPSLQFIYDDTELKANQLSHIIDQAVASDHHSNNTD
ncbi:MAG: ribosome-binding factor A [Proteobacteria bacterium]|nr:MAG: ribosome-binding factor A [Pseudomonadota bacterium]